MKFRFEPIRVFCLHHVCEQFDTDSMYPCDWMALGEFKQKINTLRNEGYQFISLTEAYKHLKNDYFRRKKYAVLTFDDGYKSLLEILPWLEEQCIPATLFINGKYLDGKSYRETPNEQYLTYDEIFSLTSHLIEVGHHGWEHTSAHKMSLEDFKKSVRLNIKALSAHPCYVPFWAYTWGEHTTIFDIYLKQNNIIYVTITGSINYQFQSCINRELLSI